MPRRRGTPGTVTIGAAELDNAARQLGGIIDPVNGGTRGAPKFPQAALFELLWRAGLRTGEARYFAAVEITLDHICEGGIYDHLGGGFSRYSVDERWLVAAFREDALRQRPAPRTPGHRPSAHRQAAIPAARARDRRLAQARNDDGRGRVSASLDADSEGEEGKFYVWSYDEIIEQLGIEDGEFFARHYDVTPQGNFEGHNILNRLTPRRARGGRGAACSIARKTSRRAGGRVRPGLDDKVLADWNGLMIAALANASLMLDEPSWLGKAKRAFAFIARAMTRGDRLAIPGAQGQLKFPGLASDFAAMIRAALALYEASGEQSYLDQAFAWQHALDRDYANAETGTYYLTAADAEGLVIRPAATADEATPNHNAVAAQNLIRLALLAGDDAWRQKADRLIAAVAPETVENLYMHMALLNAIDLRLRAAEIVVTGRALAPTRCWPRLARSPARPHRLSRPRGGYAAALAPGACAASGDDDEPQAFVCVGDTCSLPVTDPAGLLRTIEAVRHT